MMAMRLESSIQKLVILVLRVKDIAIISIFAAILFVQEQLLTVLANVQLTILLLVLYSKCMGLKKTSLIVIIHVILDNLFMGSFNYLVIIFMFLGWIIIPLTLTTIFKKINSPIELAFLGVLYAFIFSWIMIYPGMILQELTFFQYMTGDIFFEIILAISSFVTILWLYEPLSKAMNEMMNNK